MGLDGGGGGGGGGILGVGNVFTGPSESLEYIGSHAFVQSGTFAKDTSQHTYIDFTMGPKYLVGEIIFHGAGDESNPANGNISAFTVSFNGTAIFLAKTDSSDENSPHSLTMPLIIPPRTQVKVTGEDYAAGNEGDTAVSIYGRVYA